MKQLLTIALIVCGMQASAQNGLIEFRKDGPQCPTYRIVEEVSPWRIVDSLKRPLTGKQKDDWVYDRQVQCDILWNPKQDSNEVLSNYCPCGCHPDEYYTQKRISPSSGVVQEQRRTVRYVFVPAPPVPKTPYQQVEDSLRRRNP